MTGRQTPRNWLMLGMAVWGALFVASIEQRNLLDAAEPAADIFRRENLVAWCIVPFDSQKRGPEARAAMLAKLGVRRLAYDYRAEHIPTFEAELDALAKHNIELTAWWFPGTLNDEARQILALLKRRGLKTQLWVTGGGAPTKSPEEQAARVQAEAARLRPLVEAAAEAGCQVGLYNHGGWFGEPDNQLEIIKALDRPNVGVVYNLHHGHDQIEQLPGLLERMQPHLLAFNLNGMIRQGDQKGMKIVPIGVGDDDEFWLRTLQHSGYTGPIGILNHTGHDAELRLLDNLDGLNWLIARVDGKPAVEPQWRTWQPESAAAAPVAAPASTPGVRMLPGKAEYRRPPLTIEVTATLTDARSYNILIASDTKASGTHWELFTLPQSGKLSAYLPGFTPDHVHSDVPICDGKRHQVTLRLGVDSAELLVDRVARAKVTLRRNDRPELPGGLAIGGLVERTLGCRGTIHSVRLLRGLQSPETAAAGSAAVSAQIDAWNWDAETSQTSEPQEAVTPPYDLQLVEQLVADAARSGNVGNGVITFAAARFACLSCHKIGAQGGAVGPELTQIGKQRTSAQIAESILWPRREVKPEFMAWTVVDADGRVLKGYKQHHDDKLLRLRDPATGTVHELATDAIDELVEAGTLMPDGLAAAMSAEQRRDLVAFLSALGRDSSLELESIEATIARSQVHGPAPFKYTREPLVPEDWPSREHPVNRDRIYDFYTKEAAYFRAQHHRPTLVPEFPGLDGGTLGHWGNQHEQVWANDRWNQTLLGNVQAGVFRGNGVTVPRGVCVKLGENGELSACFNPETLTYDAVWKEGFVRFSSVRHGFMHGLQMAGTPLPRPDSQRPASPWKYLGFYRDGNRVAFAYRVGDVDYLDAPWVRNGQFERIVAPMAEHPWRTIVNGGRRQWPETIVVQGTLGAGRPYAVDTIPLPFENPWRALLFVGDHDFLSDGTAVVCTMQGDIWLASGVNGNLEQVTWRRYASGLHHALGLVVVDDVIYVQGRDQITRLHDLNGDGEADFYECFSNAFVTSPAGHDFICGLERDSHGIFYTASGNQGLIAISPDGRECQVLATGFRNPDGLGLEPNGLLTVPCSEGDWTPASMICAVRPGVVNTHLPGSQPVGGFSPPYFGYGGPRDGRAPDLPLVYLPRGLDNSSGGQVFVSSDRWGPLQGLMVHLSFGSGTHFLLLKDEVEGQLQGAVVPLPGEFRSGAHRGAFHPVNGQLYVSGMAGWGSYTPDDGCLQRVRYTGEPVQLPVAFHVHENGILVRFSAPLDRAVVENPANHLAQCWNYRYSGGYGSAEFSTQHFGARGHDILRIESAQIVESGQSIFLAIPDLQPVNQLHLQLTTSPGVTRDLLLTVHRLGDYFQCHQPRPAEPKVVASHPIVADLAWATKRIPNPWLKRNHQARPVVVEAGKNLTFSTRSFSAKAGEALRLTFKNPDVVPHNWVLTRPGSLETVGGLANRLVADPEAVTRHYVPHTDDVLIYTDVVPAQDEFTIWFQAPKTPGRYPYLCTFPGHWMVMNGELIVE